MRSIIRIIHIVIALITFRIRSVSMGRGKAFASFCKEMGPCFIKLGQTLSVRPDLVGKETAAALTHLQDNLPPFAFSKAKTIIEDDLNAKLADIFESFDQTPTAAASIAQVHHARLHDGREVAVKILRPGIEKRFYRDLRLLYIIAKILGWFPRYRRLRLHEVIATFERSIRKELDLRMEAACASELADNMKNDPFVHVPQPLWPYLSKRILTLEWVHGISIQHKEELIKAGHQPQDIAKRLAIIFFNQAYRDGFFHADLHPGNLFVDADGKIVLIDFGIMGRLDRDTRLFVAQILKGFIDRDYHAVAKIHFDAGYVPAGQDIGDFALACRAIGEPIMGLRAADISIGKLLALLFAITEEFSMETQPQLLLLQRSLVVVEGVGQGLDENVNLWELAEPWIASWAKENLGPKALLTHEAMRYVEALKDIPDLILHAKRLLEENASTQNSGTKKAK